MEIENIFDDIRFKVSPSDDYRSSYKFRIIKEIKTANNHCHPSFWNGIMILKKV